MSSKGLAFAGVHDQDLHFSSGPQSTLTRDLLDQHLREETEFEGIVGQSPTLRHVLRDFTRRTAQRSVGIPELSLYTNGR
jgi:molybdenum cofactor biosynthesis enzyme MoaA